MCNKPYLASSKTKTTVRDSETDDYIKPLCCQPSQPLSSLNRNTSADISGTPASNDNKITQNTLNLNTP